MLYLPSFQDFSAFSSACEDKVSTLLRGCTSPSPRMVSGKRPTQAFGDSPLTDVNQGGFRHPSVRIPVNSPKSVSSQVACVRERRPLLSSPPHILRDSIMHSSNSSPVERRLCKLQQYGEPPPLSPLILMPVQPILCKEFHVPLRKGSPVSSIDSPPLSLESDPG